MKIAKWIIVVLFAGLVFYALYPKYVITQRLPYVIRGNKITGTIEWFRVNDESVMTAYSPLTSIFRGHKTSRELGKLRKDNKAGQGPLTLEELAEAERMATHIKD